MAGRVASGSAHSALRLILPDGMRDGLISGPAQVTTGRLESRSFRVSRQGRKIVLTFVGPDDDRREYDGALFTLIQNGKVVRRWRRVD